MKQFIYRTLPIVRTFTTDKLIKSPLLNRLGWQPLRMKIADWRFSKKSYSIPTEIQNDIAAFRQNGIIQYDNFLEESEFAALKQDCAAIKTNENWQKGGRKDGPNMIYMLNIFSLDLQKYPAIARLLENKKLNALFSALEKRPINIANEDIIVQFQYLVQGENDGTHDPETELHADTFFNTHKAWIYLDEVKLANGPFVFVPSTNNIYLNGRLEREKTYSNTPNVKGSRRVLQEELDELGLQEKVYTCNQNTMVMANTLGYHRRLKGDAGNDRLTIAFSARANPFL